MTHTEKCEKAFLKYGTLIRLKRGKYFKSKHYNLREYSQIVTDKYVKYCICKMCRNIVVSDVVKSERVGRDSYCSDPYTAPRSLVRGVYLTPSNLWRALITRLNQRSTRFLQTRPLNCFHIQAHGTLLGPGMAG